jgi:hypothetical protein
VRVDHLALPVEQLPEQHEAVLPGRVGALALLVSPVRSHTELGEAMHLARADLNLDHPPLGTHQAGVQRLVTVALGHRDVVVHLMRHGRPHGVHEPEHRVTILDALGDDAQRAQVVDLLEADQLLLHLAVDAVHVLGAARDLRLDPGLGQLRLQEHDAVLDVSLAARARLRQRARQL